MPSPFKQTFSKEQALQKLKHYCAYQERCHQEVREKLFSLGLHQKEAEELVSQLIEENYLNEERFAVEFTGGKFRVKRWGRIKIRHVLNQKQVGEYCIKKALAQIEEETYQQTLQKLAIQKWETLKAEKNILLRKQKTQNYLLQKGYEPELIHAAIDQLNG